MKAVIVECSNGAAVALCDDGTFRKLKNKGYSIGQELLVRQKSYPNRMVQKLSICASLALVLLSFVGIGSYSYVDPYSYVSLDINPSIEYALNRYDKVISVSGINDEGQQVVSSIEADIKNQNITTALGVTIGQLEKDNYIIHEGYNHVIVSVYSTNDIKAQSITSRVNTLSAEKSDICSIDTIPVSKEVKDNADSLGITPGKLALIHAVAETTSDSNFDVSEWTDKTVSELETTIQQASSQVPDSDLTPASVNVVNSEYLSSVLDDNAANKSDTTATASAVEGNKEAGSSSTDKYTTTTDDAIAGTGNTSVSKPDDPGNLASPANSSADSSSKSDAATADNHGAANQDISANGTDKNTSSSKNDPNKDGSDKGDSDKGNSDKSGTSPAKNPVANDKNSGSSQSKDSPAKDNSSSSGSHGNTDAALKEDNSGKKDPYPAQDADALEETSNGANPGAGEEQSDTGTGTSEESPSEPIFPEEDSLIKDFLIEDF